MPIVVADAIFWVAVACCAIAQVMILRSALVAPLAEPTEPHLPRTDRRVEVAWTIVPAVGLALLLWFTWHAIHP